MNVSSLIQNKYALGFFALGAIALVIYNAGKRTSSNVIVGGMAQPDPTLVSMGINAQLKLQELSSSKEIALATLANTKSINDSNNSAGLQMLGITLGSQKQLAELDNSLQLGKLGYQSKMMQDNNALTKYMADKEYDFKTTQLNADNAYKTKELSLNTALKEQEISTNYELTKERDTSYYSLENIKATLSNALGIETIKSNTAIAKMEADAAIRVADIQGSASVNSAKASKTRGISCCGFGLSF